MRVLSSPVAPTLRVCLSFLLIITAALSIGVHLLNAAATISAASLIGSIISWLSGYG